MVQQADNDRLKEALGHYKAGRLNEARAVYLAMLKQQPELVEAMQMLGIIAYQTKEYDRAIGYFQQVISRKPDWPETYNNLGACFWEQGKIEQAIAAYKQAIAVKPDYFDAYDNLVVALEKQGKRLEAIELLIRNGAAHEKLAAMLKKEKRYQEASAHYQQALACYEKVISIDPKCADAYYNAAKIMEKPNRREEAIAYCKKAIAIKPKAKFYNQLGNCYQRWGNLAEAIACYQKAIALKPDFADAYSNLGVALQEQLKLQEAMSYFRHAIALKPDQAETHLNLGMCLLSLQDFQQGFVEYEWRWRLKAQPPTPEQILGKPLWDGSPLAGKTILLHTEQGYGDAIQFVRYAPLVAQRGAGKVILETNRALRRLFTTVSGIQEVVVKGEPLPAFDLQVPLMSLPRILGTTIETIPARIPYLYAEEKDAAVPGALPRPSGQEHAEGAVKYSELLRTEGEVKVGIVWAAKSHAASKRSCPVSLFLELSQIPWVSLYSLQKEHTDILDGAPIQDLRELLHDFADTAAVISQLDLVISVDTSVAHLAGALGKPVWVLLPFSPDWRWLLDRSDSPWYPTMRLFRQAKPGDWQTVFAQVKAALTVPGEL
ncbi:MAG: tetratricopeptide repeat protein [Hormoscilla sp. GM7CHS1pb]|nr:tetratricopeptide repeat protein [Hormoscilla sp. GM7CHS1pb]